MNVLWAEHRERRFGPQVGGLKFLLPMVCVSSGARISAVAAHRVQAKEKGCKIAPAPLECTKGRAA
jgi:nickel-dependent lactate racemase